ncbi:MAG: selenocysteine-specific translation elongation factor [Proteobacteria bacterium]|nr:selenocysteine-specific translation elongation factor [Pseudomonadota bacterium]MBU1711599.1 selenocysteine-specific translation elongation factor [Pseudomonadota bacterium]
MKQIVLGTAGHIDHGKTSLVKALTGINTDRLKEEQLRGITIELGFAWLDLPGGIRIGIVDVPGHEKFVKNMVAGATGIDIVAMVIAADEGVMPQTREHMEICELLGVKYGFVVLTKIDLVDEEWLELVADDLKKFVKDTFLDDAPVIQVSALSGQGIPEFIKTLDELSSKIPGRSSSGLFRLPVDRVFTMKGFGTVITGTLISGRIQVGDMIMIYPSGITSKVRGIQVHNESVNEAVAGMRTAINFQGLEKSSVNRGEVVSTPGALISSYMIDVSVHFLKSNKRPVKNRTRVRFHTGTSEILGNLVLLDREELLPGEDAVAQLRLDAPIAVVKDDRFVLRSFSPVRTIGGGEILNPIPQKHKRFKPEVTDGLKNLSSLIPEELIAYNVSEAGYRGATFSDLKIMTNITEKQLDSNLQNLLSRKSVALIDKENRLYLHQTSLEKLKKEMHDYLDGYHRANPLKAGMPKEELKSKLPAFLNPKLFNLILNQMIKDKGVAVDGDSVRLEGYKVSLGEDQSGLRKKIMNVYLESGLTPPYFKELSQEFGIDPARAKDVLMLLVDEGIVMKIKEDLYYHSDNIKGLKNRLVEFLQINGEMTTPQFKEMTGASRKFLIPLLEYFDSKNVTIRIGDIRKLRKA